MNGEVFTQKELEAIKYVRNFVMQRGAMPSIRQIARDLGYKSPRSGSMMVNKLIEKGIIEKKGAGMKFIEANIDNRYSADTVKVPLVGSVSCGMPVFAEENIEAMISVSTKLATSPHKYFLLRASGDSMNEAGIEDGYLVLIRQQPTAKKGDYAVALIDGEATIKEFKKLGDVVILLPRSTNKVHKPIYLERDFRIQGIVVAVIPDGYSEEERDI